MEQLSAGWEVARTEPGACAGPGELHRLAWRPATVPGTAAGADPAAADPDALDWWWRVAFDASASPDEHVDLVLGGIATLAEVYLNGARVLDSESMFAAHRIDVTGRLRGGNELAICCRALRPRLAGRRSPRARWRTRLVTDGNLRFHRTMLLGRAPGFAPGPAVVGPWRPVWLERRGATFVDDVRLRARVDGADGVIECRARVTGRGAVTVIAGDREAPLVPGPDGDAAATITLPGAELWWPHTHGRPALHRVRIGTGDTTLHTARVGFRELEAAAELERDGPALRINGVAVFARGAVWTPGPLATPATSEPDLRRVLERAVAAGMNMLRVPGTAAYESPAFYDLCDELGILVWQDFMFANLDYPESDEAFMAAIGAEADAVLGALAGRPCLAVLCGGSEVAQQVAMLGLDPALAHGPLYQDLLPARIAAAQADAPYLPSAPWGGELPFRTNRGVANYYGVGAYRRPLADARGAEVRFASECLAFANVPDGDLPVAAGPLWKAGVPRDVGAGWDFDDVRDHYLQLLFGADPAALRAVDPDRYLELSRAVTGEVMAEVMGEWRRGGSPCQGALILWLRDLLPGAGWGVLDHRGEPKAVYHHLRRALAPVAVWTTDEGLNGIDVHVANDGPHPLRARLRIALYRDLERLVDETVHDVALEAHAGMTHNVEGLLGRFVDASWAYRFGPPVQDLITVSLQDGDALLSQAFRFPAGRPGQRHTPEQLGLSAVVERPAGGPPLLRVSARRFAYGVRVVLPGWIAADDAFGVEPGHERVIALTPSDEDPGTGRGALTALNLDGRVPVRI